MGLLDLLGHLWICDGMIDQLAYQLPLAKVQY